MVLEPIDRLILAAVKLAASDLQSKKRHKYTGNRPKRFYVLSAYTTASMNKNSKGKRGELEAAKILADILNTTARRGRQYAGSAELGILENG